MVIFKSKQNKFEGDLKIKLRGKRLNPTESVKYLGVYIGTYLTLPYNIMLMIFPLNWIEPMFSFSKWENILVSKY